MGRVAKYKKVKSFDPYSKQNRGNIDLPSVGVWGLGDNGRRKKKRSQKAEKMHARKLKQKSKKYKGDKFMDDGGFDVPPTETDEFDMADLVGSIKRQKVETKDLLGSSSITTTTAATTTMNQNKRQTPEEYDQIVTKDGNVAHIPKTNQDETKVNKMLKLQEQFDKKSSLMATKSYARMEGESKNAYNKRTRAETRQIIKQTNTVKNHEKLARKKEFLKQKKKRKKGGASAFYYNDNNNNDDDDDDIRNNDKSILSQLLMQIILVSMLRNQHGILYAILVFYNISRYIHWYHIFIVRYHRFRRSSTLFK